MSSTNKTEKLGLNQWVASDAFNREDLNLDNRLIEEAFGKRLEWELIKTVDYPGSSTKKFNVSLDGANLTDYMAIIISIPSLMSGYMSLNEGSSGSWQVYSGTFLIGLPMRDTEQIVNFFNLASAKFANNNMRFSSLESLTFKTDISEGFSSATKIRIWGIK